MRMTIMMMIGAIGQRQSFLSSKIIIQSRLDDISCLEFTSLRLREVAAMVAAPPRLSRRREEQTRKATRCLCDHSAYNAAKCYKCNGAKANSNTIDKY